MEVAVVAKQRMPWDCGFQIKPLLLPKSEATPLRFTMVMEFDMNLLWPPWNIHNAPPHGTLVTASGRKLVSYVLPGTQLTVTLVYVKYWLIC